MIIKLKNYIKEFKYKSTTIYECDFDFYDIPFYLIDLEEFDYD